MAVMMEEAGTRDITGEGKQGGGNIGGARGSVGHMGIGKITNGEAGFRTSLGSDTLLTHTTQAILNRPGEVSMRTSTVVHMSSCHSKSHIQGQGQGIKLTEAPSQHAKATHASLVSLMPVLIENRNTVFEGIAKRATGNT